MPIGLVGARSGRAPAVRRTPGTSVRKTIRSAPSPTASAAAASSAFTFSGPSASGATTGIEPGVERVERPPRAARQRRRRRGRAPAPASRCRPISSPARPTARGAERGAQLAVDLEQRLAHDLERRRVGHAAAADERDGEAALAPSRRRSAARRRGRRRPARRRELADAPPRVPATAPPHLDDDSRRVLRVDPDVVVGQVGGEVARRWPSPSPRSSSIRQIGAVERHLGAGRLAVGEERDAVDRAASSAVRRRPARSRRRQNAEPAAARMRPQFGSRPNAAVLTSGEVAIRRAIAFASPALAAPVTVDLEQHGRALAVGDDLPREVGADLARARRRTRGRSPASRSIPLAPFASRTTASFVEHSPSTEIRLKLSSTAALAGSAAPRPARAGSRS